VVAGTFGFPRSVRAKSDFPDELACEEAVARLDACCSGFNPSLIRCEYQYPDACDESDTTYYPAVTRAESECIRGLSCAEIVASQICARVLEQQRYSTRYDSSHQYGTTVCP
jgi:hypothetical protein